MTEHSEAISTLNTLIATTIDSVTGYEDSAAEHRQRALPRDLPATRERAAADRRAASGGSPAPRRRAGRQRLIPRQDPPAVRGSEGRDHRARREVDHQRGRARRGLSQGQMASGAAERRPQRRKSRPGRALLSVGEVRSRPDEPAQARHGNAVARLSVVIRNLPPRFGGGARGGSQGQRSCPAFCVVQ